MKFGKYFENELAHSGIPKKWIDIAIPYKSLKKQIHHFTDELSSIGLEKNVIEKLIESDEHSEDNSKDFFETNDKLLSPASSALSDISMPQITINRTDSTIDKPNAHYMLRDSHPHLVMNLGQDKLSQTIRHKLTLFLSNKVSNQSVDNLKEPNITVTITLSQDSVFFNTLVPDLHLLDSLKHTHENIMITQINSVTNSIGSVTNPEKWRSDIDIWRQIFELYLDNRIFFITDDFHGERSITEASKRFADFTNQIENRQLVAKFHKKHSKSAFLTFYNVNYEIMKSLKYHQLNKMAVSKIFKKFSKQTALTAPRSLPKLLSYEPFMSQSFIMNLYSQMSQRLIEVVPQIDDYNCPICLTIAFRPIRLKCNHVFCVQCLINLQRQRKDKCPVCREPCVMEATSLNLDKELQEYMKKYFPKQVKEKRKERRQAIEEDIYGRRVEFCSIM